MLSSMDRGEAQEPPPLAEELYRPVMTVGGWESTFQHGWGEAREPPPLAEKLYWQLMTVGGLESFCLQKWTKCMGKLLRILNKVSTHAHSGSPKKGKRHESRKTILGEREGPRGEGRGSARGGEYDQNNLHA